MWRKGFDRRLQDPEGAITIARTLLEFICKHIGTSSQNDEEAAVVVVLRAVARKSRTVKSQIGFPSVRLLQNPTGLKFGTE